MYKWTHNRDGTSTLRILSDAHFADDRLRDATAILYALTPKGEPRDKYYIDDSFPEDPEAEYEVHHFIGSGDAGTPCVTIYRRRLSGDPLKPLYVVELPSGQDDEDYFSADDIEGAFRIIRLVGPAYMIPFIDPEGREFRPLMHGTSTSKED